MEKSKKFTIAMTSVFMSWLGVLAIPIFLLIICNLLDYVLGLIAAKHRQQCIDSYKGLMGIVKKICTWILVAIGAMMDILINYASGFIGLNVTIPFIVATVVAVWLVVNEIISILENISKIGVDMPPFLMPLIKNLKKQVEEKTNTNKTEK